MRTTATTAKDAEESNEKDESTNDSFEMENNVPVGNPNNEDSVANVRIMSYNILSPQFNSKEPVAGREAGLVAVLEKYSPDSNYMYWIENTLKYYMSLDKKSIEDTSPFFKDNMNISIKFTDNQENNHE